MITKSEQAQVERQTRDSQIRYRRIVLGESIFEVAQRFGVSPERVRQIAPGSIFPTRNRQAKALRVLEKAKTGPNTVRGIAESLGYSTGFVQSVLVEHGVKLRITNADLFEQGLRRCAVCKGIKPLSEFGPLKTDPQGYNRKCRPCNRGDARKYYRKDTP